MTGNDTPEKNDAHDVASKAASKAASKGAKAGTIPEAKPTEIGGRNGPEPTRYGDWEVKGICSDF